MTDIRSEWQSKVSWNEGVFNSLERFVDTKPSENIEAFAESGSLSDLYGDRQMPQPKPVASHREYMQEYAVEQTK